LSQSLLATPLPPHQPLYQPQPGSHDTSPSQNHDQPPHQRPLITSAGHESLRSCIPTVFSPIIPVTPTSSLQWLERHKVSIYLITTRPRNAKSVDSSTTSC
jgi:hypothetical protein